MIANECPDISHFGKMPLNLKRPAFKCSFAFPKQLFVTMDVPAIDIVFGCIIAKEAQIEKIRSARQEFERCKISLVKGSGVRPHPADAMLFQKPDELRPMPSSVTKFNRKAEIPWQLTKEIAQRQLPILW